MKYERCEVPSQRWSPDSFMGMGRCEFIDCYLFSCDGHLSHEDGCDPGEQCDKYWACHEGKMRLHHVPFSCDCPNHQAPKVPQCASA